LQKIISNISNYLKSKELDEHEFPSFEHKFGFLIASSDKIYPFLKDATNGSYDLGYEHINIKRDKSGQIQYEPEYIFTLNDINPGNIDIWIKLIERVIFDLSKLNKSVIHTEDFYKALDTLFNYYGSSSQGENNSRTNLDIVLCLENRNEVEQSMGGYKTTSYKNIGLWCFNPAIVFKRLSRSGIRSIILASGTLKPIKEMEQELGTEFALKFENSHVVQPEQVICGVVTSGILGSKIDLSFKNRMNNDVIADIGMSIIEIMQMVPDGILIFFSSYAMMNKYMKFWDNKNIGRGGIMDKMLGFKQIFREPKNSSDFKHVKQAYEEYVYNIGGAAFVGV
jgi:Rad3-related DNA helicase